jgi:hypothetical protein
MEDECLLADLGEFPSIVVAIPIAIPIAGRAITPTWSIVAVAAVPITVTPIVVIVASVIPVGAIIVRLPPAASPIIADQPNVFDA